MTQLAAECAFRLFPMSSFQWASWDDEFVVFDEASGQTHLLDPIKALILDTLTDAPMDVSGLTPLVSDALAVPAEINAQELVSAALEQLERSQLVEMVSL